MTSSCRRRTCNPVVTVAERMIEVNGVELCTSSFGDPSDPPILLVMGIGASMLWWEEGFCRLLADGGRFVLRYDHRDTGRSVTYEPGQPVYTGADLVADAVGVLEAYGIGAAHMVGVSAGGAFAQLLGLRFPDRVRSLVLISTSPALPLVRDLPPATEPYHRFLASATVDWSDDESVIEYLVGYARMLAGDERPFDEAATRDLVRRDVERARDIAASENHSAIAEGEPPRDQLSSIAVPTLVIHGTVDPLFPLEHGVALAEAIPRAELLALEGAGHGVVRADWERIARAIIRHTPARRRTARHVTSIRPLTSEDAGDLAAILMANREFLAPFEPDRDERFYTSDGQRERIESGEQQAFAILDGERIAGTVALSNIVRGPFQSANLGYWVAQEVNGRGLATRAVGEVIEFAFGELGLHRLEAGTQVDNVASRRVLEKNGFEAIGIARRYLRIAGEWRDHMLFELLSD